jgi:tetratricopeptide (TPR) repeat protein
MTFSRDRTRRRLVPRWKTSSAAATSPEFVSLRLVPAVEFSSTDQRGAAVRVFAQERSLGSASEALSEALLEGNSDAASEAVDYVLVNRDTAPRALLQLAESFRFKTPDGPPLVSDTVPQTRQLLRIEPNNPVLWSDMARHYATLGNKRDALRCMKAALQLAPNHRWMLRTAARFFVHQGDAAQAHRMLVAHPSTRHDPWLVAAELSCAQVAERAPKYWQVANDMIRFDRFAPRHLSELATAVGMMELEGGQRKKARKLVAKGLVAPTENTLAQVLWAKERRHLWDGESSVDALVDSAPDAYEAEFKLRLQRGDLQGALVSAQQWKLDEPFAARPKQEIGYVASLLDNYDLTIRMADEVLRVDGRLDETLELNRIFAQLSSGSFAPQKDGDAILQVAMRLQKIALSAGVTSYHATANLALWHYRFGDPEVGKDLYRRAIETARKSHGPEAAAQAAVFAAREALLASDPGAQAQLSLAHELASHAQSETCNFYLRKLDALARAPHRAKEVLSPSFDVRLISLDATTGSVGKQRGLTQALKPGTPLTNEAEHEEASLTRRH